MRILHTADIHLRNDSDPRWHALGVVLDRAAALGADVTVISGDLFDRDVDAQQLKTSLRARFETHGGRVLILPGNHDNKGIRSGDFYGERVTVMAAAVQSVDIDGARFVALPFADGGTDRTLERLHEASALCDEHKANILLFHGELLDLIPGGGAFGDEDPDYMPVRLASFGGLGFDYVLAGHFHRSYAVHRYEGGYFVYPGSPASITIRETGRRHANVVDVSDAPRPDALDTHHFEPVEVRLDPFHSVHPVTEVDDALRGMHTHAEVLLTISGFVNLAALGLTETELHAELKKEIARWRVKDLDARWIDVRDVIDHELFKKFNAALGNTAGAGESISVGRRGELRELVLRALMELVYAR